MKQKLIRKIFSGSPSSIMNIHYCRQNCINKCNYISVSQPCILLYSKMMKRTSKWQNKVRAAGNIRRVWPSLFIYYISQFLSPPSIGVPQKPFFTFWSVLAKRSFEKSYAWVWRKWYIIHFLYKRSIKRWQVIPIIITSSGGNFWCFLT